jgi:S-adenosylmethionine:tRNA ribosyltransferase-isomerase
LEASELDYDLPAELIAQQPLPERDGARLLCLERARGAIQHRQVRELAELLPPSLLVLNDTRVIPARLIAEKASGGRVEFLLLERRAPGDAARERSDQTQHWNAIGKTSRGVTEGMTLRLADGFTLTVERMLGHGELELRLDADAGVAGALERHGRVPLPPYIRRAPEASDRARYQTVFAAHDGAVAAPTAGLHLSEALLEQLRARGHELAFVTLHVGPGTFAPLRAETLADHVMHEERFVVPEATVQAVRAARSSGRQVLAVGTTVVRALESSASESGELRPGAGATSIFIYPPYGFRVVEAMLTNFHLPRSTLLALVMAFAGEAATRRAYAEAVAERYRFFSYGDAMLIGGS